METFGDALRRFRGQVSLRTLARRTSYSHSYLGEIERNLKRPTMQLARRCDEALDAGGALVALAARRMQAAVRDHGSRARHDGGVTLPTEEFAMAAAESAGFIRKAGSGISPELIEQLSDEVRTLAIAFVRRPPYAVFKPIADLRREVLQILDGHVRPDRLTDLYLLAGQLTALLAHACADLGQPGLAEAHARTAWMCADMAGHDQLRAYVRWVQSNCAYWNNDYARAAQIAAAGDQYASRGSSQVRLASQEARAWAAMGDSREVERVLQVARAARDRMPTQPIEAGVFWFNPGKAAYYSAEAWLGLKGKDNATRALHDATEALALFDAEEHPCSELVAAAQLDLISAHAALGDAHAVEQLLSTVLELPVERRTVPVVERAAKIGRGLIDSPFASSAIAADLHERISLFVSYPATRELTA